MRSRWRDQRGGVSAEQIGVLVLVAAVIGAVWAVRVDDRVGEVGVAAVDCLFDAAGGTCDLPAGGAGDDGDAGGTDTGGATGEDDDTSPHGDAPPADREVIDGAGGDGRGEGDEATGDTEVDDLYDHFGSYHDYLWDRFGRASYDDDGAPMIGTVRSPRAPGNAFWDPGAQEMHYGEGFATLDVTAHELTHALISATADLEYQGESGALNEAIADMFASNLDGNWTIGEDLPDGAIRDMADPAAHGQPAHVDDYVVTNLDHGGVHTNSGIPNRAYVHVVENIGRDAAEQILYTALTEHLERDSGFEDFRTACLQAAADLYGEGSPEQQGVDAAFAEVGLDGTWEAPS